MTTLTQINKKEIRECSFLFVEESQQQQKKRGNDGILHHHWETIIRIIESGKNHPGILRPVSLRNNRALTKNITPRDSHCLKGGR